MDIEDPPKEPILISKVELVTFISENVSLPTNVINVLDDVLSGYTSFDDFVYEN
ncbi:hypothetical protein [Peribacillus loiseleuriae]|uniref:hypothetical protein n=1 Tax=Peribacillus loiseleuriae TaxID=1679170 RepID=UPI003D064687